MGIPTTEPLQIQAGDLTQWNIDLSDYPAGTWTLSYTLLNSTDKISITAGASGTTHAVSVAAATTAGYKPGIYKFQGYVSNGSSRYKVREGSIAVIADFASAKTLDTRSGARKVLDAVEAEILARTTGGASVEYSIGSRSLKKEPLAELVKLRDKYLSIVRSEENAERASKGLASRNKLYTRFR